MSIAAAVLDAVRSEAAARPGAKPLRAGLRIGELSGVEPDSLRFCLEALIFETDLESLTFEFEILHWTRRCRACGSVFRVENWNPACSACKSPDTEAAGGDEMELSYLELEEP
jgi:hydrogenase nickel incorporation protein HypA/HybF